MTLSAPSLCLSVGRSVRYISVTYRSWGGKQRGVIKFYREKRIEAERFPLYVGAELLQYEKIVADNQVLLLKETQLMVPKRVDDFFDFKNHLKLKKKQNAVLDGTGPESMLYNNV